MLKNEITTVKTYNAKALTRKQILDGLLFLGLLGLCILVPQLSQNQFITGSIVNLIILSSLVKYGKASAIIIASVPSIYAYTFGIIPAILAPFIPFIIIANIIYLISFNYLSTKNKHFLSILVSSTTKALFLFLILNLFSIATPNLIIPNHLFKVMGINQLITATIGSSLVILFKTIKNKFYESTN